MHVVMYKGSGMKFHINLYNKEKICRSMIQRILINKFFGTNKIVCKGKIRLTRKN